MNPDNLDKCKCSSSVAGALRNRRSIRAFLPDAVPREEVEALLATALRAPTGGNVQPYRIHILTGATLSRLGDMVGRQMDAGIKDPVGLASYPRGLNAVFDHRRRLCGEELYRTLGIPREDRKGRQVQFARNALFFGAPVGLIFTLGPNSVPSQWLDLGILMQSVMLLSTERGLASCSQGFWAHWPTAVAEVIGLEAGQTVAAGMALGFPDPEAVVNHLNMNREPSEAMVEWHGAWAMRTV